MNDLKLPKKLISFLEKKDWELFNYQINFLKNLNNSSISRFLISSDTGTGKTISLFLPVLIDNLNKKNTKIIYISPLKSILSDLYDNLKIIISELGLNIELTKELVQNRLKKKTT